MKAVVFPTYGSPDVLSLSDIAKPAPASNEVLVCVHATTVNRTDCGVMRAKPAFIRLIYGLRKPRVTILGNEFAGEIESVGKDVTSFKVGDKVCGYNDRTFGGHAEYMTVREDGLLATIPEDLTYEEAAPIFEGAHYALNTIRAARVTNGQRVLVCGATGAIGSAAVQILKHFGAEVTATCATDHMRLVASLGADSIVDYTREDVTQTSQTYDLVLDAVGKSSFGSCRKVLNPNGIYSSTDLGFLAQNPLLTLWTSRFGSKKVMMPIPRTSREDILFLKELVEAGSFKPVIDRSYQMEQIADAFRYVEKGFKTGNVVVTVGQPRDITAGSKPTPS